MTTGNDEIRDAIDRKRAVSVTTVAPIPDGYSRQVREALAGASGMSAQQDTSQAAPPSAPSTGAGSGVGSAATRTVKQKDMNRVLRQAAGR